MTNPTTDKPAHTPEPEVKATGRWIELSENGRDIAECQPSADMSSREIAARFAECWNACKGIDYPAKAIEQARKALEEAGSTIATARKFMPEGPRQMVLFNGKDVTYGEMCDLTNEIIRAALSLLGAKDGMEGM